MSELEKKVNALIALCTANDEVEKSSIIDQLKGLASSAKKISVADVLLEIGVPDAISGHRYVKYAIELATANPEIVHFMTKGLYPEVAKRFGTTPSRAERAIRHAIESAWDRGDLDVLERYFGNTVSISKGKPTNSEFIARIANYLRNED